MEQNIVADSELVSGHVAVRRRWRTTEEKRRIVEETLAPGASVAQVARLHGVNANQVFHWRRQYRGGDLAIVSSEGPKLLPIVVSDIAEEVPKEVSADSRIGSMHIEFFGRALVTIEAGVDPAWAAAIVERLVR